MSAILHIKNMVCPRCIESVTEVLQKNGFEVESIDLGVAKIDVEPKREQIEMLSKALHLKGFELLADKKQQLIDHIKSEIIKLVHHSDNETLHTNLSAHLARTIGADYSSISNLFSASEGITIEKFTILQKIEKVKELLSYGELTASEIAFRMGYSSAAHLSSQFKKETGMTPGQYKKLKDKKRNPLDQIGNA